MIQIRKASTDELSWINERYEDIQFIPSDETDYVAIAEVGGKPAGLGRVVDLGDRKGELGGMYVFKEFRGSGVSRAIIEHLLDNASNEILYCLPFANLEGLYASFGFRKVVGMNDVPEKMLEKHRWCNEYYSKSVLLMKMALNGRAV